MVVVAIDQEQVDRCAGQPARGGEAAEPGTDQHDPGSFAGAR